MPEIQIVRAIKPKQGMYIAEGSSKYIGKHPYAEDTTGFWTGMEIVWRGRFFSSQKGIMVLPDLCVGVSPLSDALTKTEARWSAVSAGQKATPLAFGALGGLITGAVRAALTETKDLKGFVVCYENESKSTGAFLATATPEIVDEIFSVMPEERIVFLQGISPDR
jgi:hypothetical protein